MFTLLLLICVIKLSDAFSKLFIYLNASVRKGYFSL